MKSLTLDLLPFPLSICKFSANTPLPTWAMGGGFFSVTRTPDELSVVCESSTIPNELSKNGDLKIEGPWRALKVRGTLDFSLTGILASVANPLAHAGVSIFAVSTFDTDYVLVKENDLEKAVVTLKSAGHNVVH